MAKSNKADSEMANSKIAHSKMANSKMANSKTTNSKMAESKMAEKKISGMAITTLGPEERPVGRPERYYYQSATQPTAYFEIDLRTCKNLTKLKLRSNGGLYFFRTQRIENSGANLS